MYGVVGVKGVVTSRGAAVQSCINVRARRGTGSARDSTLKGATVTYVFCFCDLSFLLHL